MTIQDIEARWEPLKVLDAQIAELQQRDITEEDMFAWLERETQQEQLEKQYEDEKESFFQWISEQMKAETTVAQINIKKGEKQ